MGAAGWVIPAIVTGLGVAVLVSALSHFVAGRFGQGTGVTADNWTTAGLRFNDRPAEAFEARRIEQRYGAIIKRLKQFVRSIRHLCHVIGNSKTVRQRK